MANAKSIIKLEANTNDYERNIKKAQKTFNDFTRSMGVDMKKLSALGLAIGAVSAAVKVAGDAFKQNELVVDEWGRTVQSAKSLYSGFLNALNTGNISGYLRNMNNIVSAARAAYDAMDELNTFNAFNQINDMKARTGLTEAINAYREGTGSKSAVEAAAAVLKDNLSKRQFYEANEYKKEIERLAESRGVNATKLMAALSGSYRDYKELKELPLTGTKTVFYGGGMFGGGGSYQKMVAANEEESLGLMLRQFNDTELRDLQALGLQAERTALELAQVDRQVLRATGSTRGGGGTSGGASSSPKGLTPEQYGEWFGMAYYTALANTINSELKDSPIIQEPLISEEDLKIEEQFANTIETLAERTERLRDTWDLVAESISTVGGALAGLEDPTARIAGTIIQAVATLALSYAEAAEKASKLGPVAWMAFAATGLATFIGAASSIKSTTKGGFAEGGIIPGNYYGDQLSTANYGLSSGELILNRAQQGNLASQLANGGGRMELSAVVTGEQIRFVLNNHGRRTGRGEYIQTNFGYVR